MATASVTYSFAVGETIASSKLNQNYTDLVNFVNNSVVHKDGSVTMTGALTLPSSDPVSANQAARKAYVDTLGLQVFATTAARDAAITAPVDGQFCYVNSNDANEGLYSYNGTSWRKGPGWNAPWGYLTQINGSAPNTVLRAGSASTATTAVSGSYTHVNNRRVRVTAYANVGWTTTTAAAAQLTIGGTGVAYEPTQITDQMGACLVAQHTASGSAVTYSFLNQFSASNSNVKIQVNTPFILLEDIGPAGAPV